MWCIHTELVYSAGSELGLGALSCFFLFLARDRSCLIPTKCAVSGGRGMEPVFQIRDLRAKFSSAGVGGRLKESKLVPAGMFSSSY